MTEPLMIKLKNRDSLHVDSNSTILTNTVVFLHPVLFLPITTEAQMRYSSVFALSVLLILGMNLASGQGIIWTSAGSMSTTRYFHSTIALDNGKILVAGGTASSPFSALASCELYDPATNTWSPTGVMNYARQYIQGVKLQDGRVLVPGGHSGSGIIGTCEIYNPATGLWTTTSSLSTARTGHRSVLLPNGNVLTFGGRSPSLTWLASSEIYNPTLGSWSPANPMFYPRWDAEFVILDDGRILVTGGANQKSCEIYDPNTGTWSLTDSMATRRRYHGITKLPDGKVLVTGGLSNVDTYANDGVEIYDPITGLWTELPNLSGNRWLHTSTLLPNGKVLITGGSETLSYFDSVFTVCQLFDPATQTWQNFPSMSYGRITHAAALVGGGRVVVIGGASQTVNEIARTVLLEPRPQILSIRDVPHDQGGEVTVRWLRSVLDTNLNSLTSYTIWRATPLHGIQGTYSGPTNSRRHTLSSTGAMFDWELVGEQPAHRFNSYSFTAPTLYDSSFGTNGKHFFLVSAQTSDPNVFYDSNIDSGYSVDNLPPGWIPDLAAQMTGATTARLSWPRNHSDPDLSSYAVYRSTTSGFIPNDANRLGTSVDTTFLDYALPPTSVLYYKVRAIDIHGNEGAPSPEAALILTEAGMEHTPAEFSLSQNYPNPFNPSTRIGYSLPQGSAVSLKMFDVLGEYLTTLVDGYQPAGTHEVEWVASDYPSGVYFYRIQAGGFTQTRKLILSR